MARTDPAAPVAHDYDDIPGTFVFDAEKSRQGYGINMFCMSLMKEPNRKAFKADEAAYLKQRLLDSRTKELIFIVSLTVMRSEQAHIRGHIKVALELGLSPQEILEAIEMALPEAGVVAFQWGLEAWREVVGAQGLEPSAEALASVTKPR